MPQRFNSAYVKDYVQGYGFTVADNSARYRNNKTRLTLYDYINNKTIHTTLAQFKSKVTRGRIVKVDPFLHVFGDLDTKLLFSAKKDNSGLARFERHVPAQFRRELLPIKTEALKKFRVMVAKMRRHEDFNFTHSEIVDVNKANLYAFSALLRNFIFHPHYYSTVFIIREDIPEARFINANTIRLMDGLIKSLFFGEEFEHDYTDSDKAILFAFQQWEKIELTFEYHNEKVENILDNVMTKKSKDKLHKAMAVEAQQLRDAQQQPVRRGQRIAGGFFPFINKSGIDLTKFGIFNTFEPQNYTESCLVTAIASSNLVPSADIDLLRSCLNCRIYPANQFKRISQLIHVNFTLEKYYEHKKAYGDTKLYIGDPSWPTIHLLLRDSHFFIDDMVNVTIYYLDNKDAIDAQPRINPLRKTLIRKYAPNRWEYGNPTPIKKIIDYLFKRDMFEPLTEAQHSIAIKEWQIPTDFLPLNASIKAHQLKQRKSVGMRNNEELSKLTDEYFRNWLTIKEVKQPKKLFDEFEQLMISEFDLKVYGCNPREVGLVSERVCDYSTLAQFGEMLMHKTGCFENVYELRGPVAQFIRKCCVSPFIQPAYNTKQRVEGDVIQIDKNSSYPSVYCEFEGIPSGEPLIMQQFDPNGYYYVAINVTSYT
jgi:hypothetical protein